MLLQVICHVNDYSADLTETHMINGTLTAFRRALQALPDTFSAALLLTVQP